MRGPLRSVGPPSEWEEGGPIWIHCFVRVSVLE